MPSCFKYYSYMRKLQIFFILLFLISICNITSALAQESGGVELGQEILGQEAMGQEIRSGLPKAKTFEVVEPKEEVKENRGESSTLSTVLLYLPNRVFDLLDIFRLRVRVGPGIAAGFQITKPVRLRLGAHSSVWVGLPGARQRRSFPWPAGFQANARAAASVFSVSSDISTGPDHSYSEVSVEAHAAMVGLDVGIDPVEIVDFFAGIFLVEVREDDF